MGTMILKPVMGWDGWICGWQVRGGKRVRWELEQPIASHSFKRASQTCSAHKCSSRCHNLHNAQTKHTQLQAPKPLQVLLSQLCITAGVQQRRCCRHRPGQADRRTRCLPGHAPAQGAAGRGVRGVERAWESVDRPVS